MPWLIVSNDSEKSPAIRADKEVMAAHWQYELSIKDRVIAAGSLRTDDGITPTGSLLIVDVETREEAQALIEADPATKAGLRGEISIRYWNWAILNREELP
jgi:uncharacterized protein YciI